MQAITYNLEKGLGFSGNGLDRWLTVRDLRDAGVIDAVQSNANGRPTFTPIPPPTDSTVQAPSRPLNFTVNAGFQVIILQWDIPSYTGHAYTAIYRSQTDDFSAAVRVQTSIPNIAGDTVDYGQAFYYWVRFVNENDVEGPLNATAGTFAQAAPDISTVIEQLSDELNETHLAQTLRSRIDLIDTPVTGLLDVVTELQEDVSLLESGATGSAAAIAALGTRVDAAEGSIVAISNDFTQLEATVTGIQGTADANAIAISNTNVTVTNIGGVVTAQAADITQLQTNVGDNTATIQVQAVSLDGLTAQWDVRTDVNGLVGGVGFYNDGTTTQFMVNADVFAVLDPDGTGTNPFFITEGDVWIDTALIRQASIQAAQIQSLTVDQLTGFSSNFVLSTIGTGNITNAYIGNIIQSNVFNANTGWRIDKDGDIDARSITIRDSSGNILLSSGAGFQGLGAFASLNQITSGNASTFIASAAIGTAEIGDASVNTLKIQGNAVTLIETASSSIDVLVNSSDYADSITPNGTGTQYTGVSRSITIPSDSASAAVLITAEVVFKLSLFNRDGSDPDGTMDLFVDLYVNGVYSGGRSVWRYEEDASIGLNGGLAPTAVFNFIGAPGAGTFTYQLRFRKVRQNVTTTADWRFNAVVYENRLFLTAAKR